jgi:hypothetical protein
MQKNLINFVAGVAACMLFSVIHIRVAHSLNFDGLFPDQGPVIFASGVLVALLFKNSKL